jgi:hypothetical protein
MTIIETIPASAIPENHRSAKAKFLADCKVVFRKAVALQVGQALHIRLDKLSHVDKLRKQWALDNPSLVSSYRIVGRVERDGDRRIQYVYIARTA